MTDDKNSDTGKSSETKQQGEQTVPRKVFGRPAFQESSETVKKINQNGDLSK